MQYALLTAERNSNVISKLMAKAASLEEELAIRKKREKGKKKTERRSRSVMMLPQRENCFENTLDIVLSARKQQASKLREES